MYFANTSAPTFDESKIARAAVAGCRTFSDAAFVTAAHLKCTHVRAVELCRSVRLDGTETPLRGAPVEIAIATQLRAGATDVEITKVLARDHGLSVQEAQQAIVRMSSSRVTEICGPAPTRGGGNRNRPVQPAAWGGR